MTQEEIKPSFSLKYLALTLLSAIIMGGVALAISKIYESRPSRVIEISRDDPIDVLRGAGFPTDQIEANFYLKGSPEKKIASLFRNVIVIRNAGNEGAENILVSASLTQSDAHLVPGPKIRTEPRAIIDGIEFSRNDSSTTNKEVWNISLLNPGEAVILEYFVYSERRLSSITLNILPRKKDWSVVNKSLFERDGSQTSFMSFFLVGNGVLFAILLAIFGLSFPLYRYQWNRRPDYREKYGAFRAFYNHHSPWELFKPPVLK